MAMLASATPALADKPRLPMAPVPWQAPVLWHESFDTPYYAGDRGSSSILTASGELVASWSGYALRRGGVLVPPFLIEGVEAGGQTRLVPGDGALLLWFSPEWSSASLPGGSGPACSARLVELAAVGGGAAQVLWSLQINPDGSTIRLLSSSDAGPVQLLGTGVAWLSGEPHLLGLSYGTNGTALFVDGQLVATGGSTPGVPASVVVAAIGSSLSGTEPAGGLIDEVSSCGGPLAEGKVNLQWQVQARRAQRGPVTAEEEQETAALRAARFASLQAAASMALLPEGDGPLAFGESNPCPTNGPVYLTNLWCGYDTSTGWTMTFDVAGGTNGIPHDIFRVPALGEGSSTNWPWVWPGRTYSCNTCVLTNQPGSAAFYMLGDASIDPDGDGLGTAYERLISHTDPGVYSNPDTDGDGISDLWEIQLGTSPQVNEAGQASGRLVYEYDAAGWLRGLSGAARATFEADAEGNLIEATH